MRASDAGRAAPAATQAGTVARGIGAAVSKQHERRFAELLEAPVERRGKKREREEAPDFGDFAERAGYGGMPLLRQTRFERVRGDASESSAATAVTANTRSADGATQPLALPDGIFGAAGVRVLSGKWTGMEMVASMHAGRLSLRMKPATSGQERVLDAIRGTLRSALADSFGLDADIQIDSREGAPHAALER